jgi:hypothetical protein
MTAELFAAYPRNSQTSFKHDERTGSTYLCPGNRY